MFTKKEITEIAEAFDAVKKAIHQKTGCYNNDKYEDLRNAERIAGQIVAAKIIAGAIEEK
jgi:hypothetical protein